MGGVLIIKPTRCTNFSNLVLGLNSTCFGQFYSKNKFEKLVHVVGFIITIYQDARSLERGGILIIPVIAFSHYVMSYIPGSTVDCCVTEFYKSRLKKQKTLML